MSGEDSVDPVGDAARRSACPGCGVALTEAEGPVHRYMTSSPACWAAYGEVLAREYSDPAWMAAHRLTVDAYAVQHPGDDSRQAVRSVALHLISLHAILERGVSGPDATRLLQRAAAIPDFAWLPPPANRGKTTVEDVLAATCAADHEKRVRRWAEDAWQAWGAHHDQVGAWAARVDGRWAGQNQ